MEKKEVPKYVMKTDLDNCFYQEKFSAIFREHEWCQRPWKVLKFCYALIHSLVVYLFFMRAVTDSDVVRFIEWTVLGMLVTQHRKNGNKRKEYRVEVDDCRLISEGKPLKSFCLIYTKDEDGVPTISSFTYNGIKTTNRQVMMSIFYMYQTAAFHSKCHLFSNGLTEYIIDNKLTMLYPSCRTSIPLHDGLLHTHYSPVSTPEQLKSWTYMFVSSLYSSWATRQSLADEARNLEIMKGHSKRRLDEDVPFIRYLAEGREAVKQTLLDNNLPVSLSEALFNHTIVHAVDHKNTYGTVTHLRFGATLHNRNCTNFEAFRCLMFAYMFAKPTLNPLATNKIRHQPQPFYKQLYKRMKNLDKKYKFDYADDITASVMY